MARTMNAKFPGTCYGCSERVEKGEKITWFGSGEVYHLGCTPGGYREDDADSFGHLFENEGQLDA